MNMPQKTIGILGSGQLGRMLVIAASQLGLRTHVYAPDAGNSPAGDIAHDCTEAAYDDLAALAGFASAVDAVASEFENVPARTMATLAKTCLASPGEAALHTAQHRIREKRLARELGIDTPLFWSVRLGGKNDVVPSAVRAIRKLASARNGTISSKMASTVPSAAKAASTSSPGLILT